MYLAPGGLLPVSVAGVWARRHISYLAARLRQLKKERRRVFFRTVVTVVAGIRWGG